MQKLKVTHIHTDYKFVTDSNFFECKYFENQTIIFQNKDPYTSTLKHKTIVLKNCERDINETISICKNSDLVVLYDLNAIKIRIALELPDSIKIAWRFFGYELYSKLLHIILTRKTLSYSGGYLYNKIKFLLLQSSLFIKLFKPKIEKDNYLQRQAIKRINFFLCYSSEEYYFLKNRFPELPDLIQLPLLPLHSDYKLIKGNPKKIVVGHSRSYFNNHIDLLDIIKKHSPNSNHKYILLFNYGTVNSYAEKVKKVAVNVPYTKVVDDFLPSDVFENFYDDISAFVSNSYRQIALGNIFICFVKGVKVYLNQQNIMYEWFLNEGFLVYSINDFSADITTDKLALNDIEAKHNYDNYIKFTKKYSIEKFQKLLFEYINN